jgi:hypothetical protein
MHIASRALRTIYRFWHHLRHLDIMTSNGSADPGATAGELTASQSRLRSTPAPQHIGGQPCPSLARLTSDEMSIKRPSPWPPSLKSTEPRAPPVVPSAHGHVTLTTSSARCHPRLSIWALSMKPVPVATALPVSHPKRPSLLGGGALPHAEKGRRPRHNRPP